MTIAIRVASSPGEARVAVVRDGLLVDYALWRPGSPDGVGDLYRGRITRIVPAMAGAFASLGDQDGFLPDSEGAKGLTEGTVLGLRITRSAQGGKGPRLSARGVLATDPGPVGLLSRGPDPVARLAAAWPDAPILVDDPALVVGPADRRRVDRSGFDDDLLGQVDALSATEVMLDGEVRASFHPTPALTAIDLDAGSAVGGRGTRHDALNRRAIPALARQIRLRNLSGAILVDFAGMPAKRRATLGPALAAALAEDALRPRLLGFTALGLAEIVRSRVHPPLHELMTGPLAAGLAALRQALVAMIAHPSAPVTLRAAPAVVAALEADRVGLTMLAHRAGRPLTMRVDLGLGDGAWRLDL